MTRRLDEGRLVLATHNAGKVAELRTLLRPRSIEVVSAGELGLAEPEETGLTFAENAQLKAWAAASSSGLPSLADDSGLELAGLDGAPGIYSARWAGPTRDFAVAMRRIRDELTAKFGSWAAADHRATFVAALCLAWPDGHVETAEGRVDGTLAPEPRGATGFGYDPIFRPEGSPLTFAEMGPVQKGALNHRRRALEALAARCFPPVS